MSSRLIKVIVLVDGGEYPLLSYKVYSDELFYFFCKKKTVTRYLICIVKKSKFRTKIQTFFDNLVKEPCNNINHKLRYKATKIIGEKFPKYGALYLRWEFFKDFLNIFGNGGFRWISGLFEKISIKHVSG